MTEKYICIHGHFYQPPRENPWLEEVEFEESARPYHDWNMRVTAECYAPNSVSRIMDPEGRIIGLANNYSKINFNVGPTLLYWIEKHDPTLYQAILDADKESMKQYSGHGSAIAQVYNHMIMPLANRRDKETQVKWGIRDFEERFERFPEGMWLPETAVDVETLEVLAENGIKFTVLSPHQAKRVRKKGLKDWTDVVEGKMSPSRAYECKLPSGKTINVFFYDRTVASNTSFGNMLSNGEVLANGLLAAFKDTEDEVALVSLATDGELYGHHRAHGDMALAYCLYYIASKNLAKITNYAEFLAKYPPLFELEIQEDTSWSCTHGVERWRSDCGDNTGRPGWKQTWRKPLREAMDWLRDILAPSFEHTAQEYLKDPWQARNEYISVVLDRSTVNVERFFLEHAKKTLNEEEKKHVTKLLEIQRQAMLMYTSCGWFFDEISGIEARQVIIYAARAIQLAREVFGLELENQYTKMLQYAPSNIPEYGNGAKIYDIFIKPSIIDAARMAAQSVILSLFETDPTKKSPSTLELGCFKVSLEDLERHESGKFRLATCHAKVHSGITFDDETFGCAAIWLGDHNFSCGAAREMRNEAFISMKEEIVASFEKGQINETILLFPKHFGQSRYSLKDMFKDDQQRVLSVVVDAAVKKARELYEIVYHDNSAMLRFMKENRIPPPKPFQVAAEVVLNHEIGKALTSEPPDLEGLQRIIEDSKHFAIEIDAELLGFEASERISKDLIKLVESPEDTQRIEQIGKLIRAINELPIKLNLWNAQNSAFRIAEKFYKSKKENKDEPAQAWVAAFRQLCELIGIRLD